MLKISGRAAIQEELNIYNELAGVAGLPEIFGWGVSETALNYISMEPFTRDLHHYVQETGPMQTSQACKVATTVVSTAASSSTGIS